MSKRYFKVGVSNIRINGLDTKKSIDVNFLTSASFEFMATGDNTQKCTIILITNEYRKELINFLRENKKFQIRECFKLVCSQDTTHLKDGFTDYPSMEIVNFKETQSFDSVSECKITLETKIVE